MPPRWLSRAFLQQANALMGLNQPQLEALCRLACKIADNEQWVAVWEQDCARLTSPVTETPVLTHTMEQRRELLGPDADCWPALVLLSQLDTLREQYRRRGIGEEVLRDTLSDFAIWFGNHTKKTGYIGVQVTGWLNHHMQMRLFRLGRMQFQIMPSQVQAVVLRNTRNGRIAALAPSGVRYTASGLIDGTCDIWDDNAWTAVLSESPGAYTGFPILPDGTLIHRAYRYNRPEWEKVLAPGDRILAVHVPADGRMEADACAASLSRAIAFYHTHFSEVSFPAITAVSWLLAPYWHGVLPANSNILSFCDSFYRVPHLSGRGDVLGYTFGDREADPQASAKTTLQRALAERDAAGLPIHAAAGFMMVSDYPKWGCAPYTGLSPLPD
nr:acyltransferase domain-containing protein [bacterium]